MHFSISTLFCCLLPTTALVIRRACSDFGGPPPKITNTGDHLRPYAVDGATFMNIGNALQRSCDIQKNNCFNTMHSANGTSSTDRCGKQYSSCLNQKTQPSANNSTSSMTAPGSLGFTTTNPPFPIGTGTGSRSGNGNPPFPIGPSSGLGLGPTRPTGGAPVPTGGVVFNTPPAPSPPFPTTASTTTSALRNGPTAPAEAGTNKPKPRAPVAGCKNRKLKKRDSIFADQLGR